MKLVAILERATEYEHSIEKWEEVHEVKEDETVEELFKRIKAYNMFRVALVKEAQS